MWLSSGLFLCSCRLNILHCLRGRAGCLSSSHQSTTNTVWNSVKVQLIMQERMCPGKTCLAMPSLLLGCLTAPYFPDISEFDFRASLVWVWWIIKKIIKDHKANWYFFHMILPKMHALPHWCFWFYPSRIRPSRLKILNRLKSSWKFNNRMFVSVEIYITS